MANAVTTTGLTTDSYSDYLASLTAAFETIYGADINLESDTPDGQMINIFIQATLDVLNLITEVYNSFDPDLAFGNTLDQRVAINGIQRQGGTYTVTNITLVLASSVNLYGLDQDVQPVYTVADNAGNQWQLQTTQSGVGPGTEVYSFQAASPGAVLTTPNTITVPVTIVLGVTSINNPTTYTTLGVNEETDAALKIRRQKSTSISSQGYLAGLYAVLNNLPGVTSAQVYENNTGTTSTGSVPANVPAGIPGHSIWVIVGGTASSESIATAIYDDRNAGCGMRGSTVYVITQVDGSPFPIYYDVVTDETLWIQFTATSLNGINPPMISVILSGLNALFVPGVNGEVNVNGLATDVQIIDPNTLVTNAGFSTSSGGSYTATLKPSDPTKQFIYSSGNIIITPIILSPVTSSVVHGGNTEQFTPLGGLATYTYAMVSGGGSINSSTGLYTSGIAGTDVVMVTDSLGNTGTATISVT